MSTDLPPENIELVRILAAVDSLFGVWPDPRQSNAACFEVNTRQRNYLAGRGLPWRVGGDAADRKSGERLLTSLVGDGLVTLHKVARSHRHVALTDRGDDHARSLLGFYRCSDCWNVFRGLADAVEAGPGRWATAGHVAEGLGEVEELVGWSMLYPLLTHGLVEAGVSSIAETIFTVRPDQWELATGEPPALAADPAPDDRLNLPVYWPAFHAAEAEKTTWRPSRSNCVYVSILN